MKLGRGARVAFAIVAAAVLVAGHGILLFYVSSHLALSAAIVSGVIVLILVSHLGVLGKLRGILKRDPPS